MQLRSTHLLVIAAIALLLLAVAGVVYLDQREQARTQRAKGEGTRSTTPAPSGRERCMRKCAAAQQGYIYRAEQRVEEAGRWRVVPEACRCIGRAAQ
jgi:hypothetical protein